MEMCIRDRVKNLLFASDRSRSSCMIEEKLSLEELMGEYERELLLSYLEKYSTAAEVARKLRVNKSTISRKLKKYKIAQK